MDGVAPLANIDAVLTGYARHQNLLPKEVEAVFDLITARHAVTVLLHAWRQEPLPRTVRAHVAPWRGAL
jgi:Ser/Thr protein kinase RdoA (MazF antagonist)